MKKVMIILLSAMLVLSGCTESNIVTGPSQDYSDLPQPVGGIVWDQLWADWDETYTDLELYPFSETVNCNIDPEKNVIKFFLLLNQDISRKEAAEYATAAVKGLNDLICEQNGSYTPSTEDSFGSYLEQYEIYVMVGADSTKDNTETWIIEETIPAGEYREIGAE